MTRTILSLCDYSGNWPRYYQEAGYNVIQWDILTGQDVRLQRRLENPVHGILAAPPCTVFAFSGNRWKRTEAEMLEGLSIVDACLRAVAIYNPEWWALENPSGKLQWYLGPPVFKFNPCDFGRHHPDDAYTKKTYLWGRFTPPVKAPVVPALGSKMHTNYGGSGKEKAKAARSVTPLGFARAFFEANP